MTWYERNRRDLPWRRTDDAYAIVVAEFMLQQTGVARVAAKWPEFIVTFASWSELARATPADVIRAWQGLGYNRRALNLWRTARAIVDEHDGILPRDLAALHTLPGVGPYTAAAIQAFVFGDPVPAIDVNLRRVLGRVYFGDDNATSGEVARVGSRVVDLRASAAWNQALMDLSATICRPRVPACERCPLPTWCVYPEASRLTSSIAPTRRAAESRGPDDTFVGSRRHLRGRVIEELRSIANGDVMPIATLRLTLEPPLGQARFGVDDVVAALVSEGLIELIRRDDQVALRLAGG